MSVREGASSDVRICAKETRASEEVRRFRNYLREVDPELIPIFNEHILSRLSRISDACSVVTFDTEV